MVVWRDHLLTLLLLGDPVSLLLWERLVDSTDNLMHHRVCQHQQHYQQILFTEERLLLKLTIFSLVWL